MGTRGTSWKRPVHDWWVQQENRTKISEPKEVNSPTSPSPNFKKASRWRSNNSSGDKKERNQPETCFEKNNEIIWFWVQWCWIGRCLLSQGKISHCYSRPTSPKSSSWRAKKNGKESLSPSSHCHQIDSNWKPSSPRYEATSSSSKDWFIKANRISIRCRIFFRWWISRNSYRSYRNVLDRKWKIWICSPWKEKQSKSDHEEKRSDKERSLGVDKILWKSIEPNNLINLKN